MLRTSRPLIERVERRVLLAFDDSLLLFLSNDRPQGHGIYTSDAQGGNVQNIPVPHSATLANPQFNPDETRILYDAYEGQFSSSGLELYIANADGSGETQLTDNSFYDGEACFSPDGGQIVFVSDRADGNDELWMMNADGSNPQRLTNSQVEEANPVYHPSGRFILYEALSLLGDFDLFMFDLRTGQTSQLAGSTANEYDPSFSPDGYGIVYISDRDEPTGEVYLSGLDDITTATRLTENEAVEFSPSFSPISGSFRFTMIDQNDEGQIYTIDTAGDTPVPLFTGFNDGELQWASAPAVAVLLDSQLTIWGTGTDDTITLDMDGLQLNIRRNFEIGVIIEATEFTTIDIYLREGNDLLGVEVAEPGEPDAVQRFYCLAGPGDDVVYGGDGNDTITGGAGRNTLYGGNGDDRLNGSNGRDFIYGDGGNDRIYGQGGNDYILGGANVDRIWGGTGDDFISGNGQNDKLFGEAGLDQLFGGPHDDLLDGGAGDEADTLHGQDGSDYAIGGLNDAIFACEIFS